MEIGSFVRGKRRAMGLSQQQLADRAGVGLNFVYQLEKNKATVQLDCTLQVLEALGFELAPVPMAEPPAPRVEPVRAGASRANPRLPWD